MTAEIVYPRPGQSVRTSGPKGRFAIVVRGGGPGFVTLQRRDDPSQVSVSGLAGAGGPRVGVLTAAASGPVTVRYHEADLRPGAPAFPLVGEVECEVACGGPLRGVEVDYPSAGTSGAQPADAFIAYGWVSAPDTAVESAVVVKTAHPSYSREAFVSNDGEGFWYAAFPELDSATEYDLTVAGNNGGTYVVSGVYTS